MPASLTEKELTGSETKTIAEWRAMPLAPKKRKRGRAPGKVGIEPVYKRIGVLVREMRLRHGLTQADIAEATGWSRALVAVTESGRVRVSIHDLPTLARALRIPLLDLMTEVAGYFSEEDPSHVR